MRFLTAFRAGLFLPLLLAAGALPSLRATLPTPKAPASSGGLSPAESAQGFRNGRVLVVERSSSAAATAGSTGTRRLQAERRIGIKGRRTFEHLPGIAVLEFDPSRPVDEVIRELQATGLYESVERDRAVRPLATPNDPAYGNGSLWGLHNTGQSGGTRDADIDAPEGWDIRREAPNVIVAVIDSGIRLTHEDLRGNLWTNPGEVANDGRDNDNNGFIDDVHGINAITYTRENRQAGDPNDDSGHGSHVAGTIGAVGNNGTGSTGIAWRVKLMALKFLPADGEGSTSDEIECINYAVGNGAHIINASFGSDTPSPGELTAIHLARDAGIIFVAAASNEGVDNDVSRAYPANYDSANVVSVAATTRDDELAGFSNFGSGAVDLGAPGESIYSATSDSDSAYELNQGTSMAAPHVSGVLALLRAQYPTENYRQLINRLLRGVDRVPGLTGRVQTAGRLNLAGALSAAANRPFNDDFATRARIAGANVRVRNVNAGATAEGGEPAHAGSAASASLWWEWTAVTTGRVIIDTVGSDYDTVLAVYSGSSLGGLALVTSNDNSSVTLDVTAGTTYQIVVDGRAGASGLTILSIGSVPTNDDFATATTITGASVRVDGNNRNATRQSGEPNHGGSGNSSVWYRWTAPADGTYQVAAFATEIDTLVGVYTGTSLSNLTQLDANDDAAADNTDALATFAATAGTTYSIAVDDVGSDNSGAPFTLTVTNSLWQAPATDEITGSPAVGPDGTVYFGSIDGYLYAIASNGTRKWRYNAGDEIRDSAPAIAPNGTIYVGSVDGVLHAINPSTGLQRWRYRAAATPLGSTPALAADGTIYFRDDSTLHAVTPLGSAKWTRSLSGGTYASPVVGRDGTVYIGATNGQFQALNPSDGSLKWVFTAAGDIFTSPAIAGDGTIYLATLEQPDNADNATIYAINHITGVDRWETRLQESMSSSPVIGPDGRIYVGSYADRIKNRPGKLYALSAQGIVQWAFEMPEDVRASSPAVASDGTIYIGNYDGQVYAVSSSGQLLRTLPTARGIRSSMTLANQRLYFTSADAKLYAFATAAPANSAWPQFQHAASHDGRADETPPPEEPPPEDPPPGPPDTDPRAINLSTRAEVGAGDATLIGGFAVRGGPRKFLIRAVGPGLAQFNVPNPLSNPRLQVFRGNTPFLDNDNWGDSGALATLADQVGAFALPAGSADAALVAELSDGNYTTHVTSADGSGGQAIVEFYEVSATGAGRFLNLSTRASVQPGSAAIAGFVIRSGPRRVLLRVVGPGLLTLNNPVQNPAADPRLTLKNEAGATVAENDDWTASAELAEATAAMGAFPLPIASRDAALVRTLPEGRYTMLAEVASGTGGVVLLEVYLLAD